MKIKVRELKKKITRMHRSEKKIIYKTEPVTKVALGLVLKKDSIVTWDRDIFFIEKKSFILVDSRFTSEETRRQSSHSLLLICWSPFEQEAMKFLAQDLGWICCFTRFFRIFVSFRCRTMSLFRSTWSNFHAKMVVSDVDSISAITQNQDAEHKYTLLALHFIILSRERFSFNWNKVI